MSTQRDQGGRTAQSDCLAATFTGESLSAELPRAVFFNAVRQVRRTCRVCTAPVNGFEFCWRCRAHRRIAGVADVVAPLAYAIRCEMSARVLRDYKDHPVGCERDRCRQAIAWMLREAVYRHERCLGAAVGIPITIRVVVPSLTGRQGRHPMASIATDLGLTGDAMLVAADEARCDRVVDPRKFVLRPAGEVQGGHVLVIDDAWTTGCNAQSAAVLLHRSGAAAVSVLVIARWVDPAAPPAAWLRRRRLAEYDPSRCPVTGDRCPVG